MSGTKIKIAVVGCGRISSNHFKAIDAYPDDLELVGVVDNQEERRTAKAKETATPGFESLEEMVASVKPDCVVLTTPSGIHAEQAIAAARLGVHVVTEKPMATRWQDGIAMVRACDEHKKHLFVVKQNRRNTTIQMLKRVIDEGHFGKLYSVQVNVFWTRPQSYYDQDAWRGTWEFDGGAVMNQASHYVDLMDWLFGPVESVQAMTATLARHIEVEDSAVVNIRWRSGTLGGLNVSMLTYPKNYEGSITVIGEKGTVRIGGVAINQVEKWDFDHELPAELNPVDASYETDSVYGHGHTTYYKNVVATLRGEEEPETHGREGLRSLELLIAIYLAARDGKRIALPLEY